MVRDNLEEEVAELTEIGVAIAKGCVMFVILTIRDLLRFALNSFIPSPSSPL